MSNLDTQKYFNLRSTEFRLTILLFLLLWVYLIIRAFSVFYIHDEIVTKWSYVIHWNPFPNQGAIDANNHFLLSLLAGFFTRLFNSDSMFLIRLGSVLAFPIYFWSIFRLKYLFQQKWNFYALLIALTTSSFLIEYFALARGYGLGLAFLVFSIQQMICYFDSDSKKALIGSLIGWLLTVYASLTLLPITLIAVFFIGIYTARRKFYIWILPVLLMVIPLGYFVEYSFVLKDLGKLYYGGAEGFFSSTIHSLTKYVWLVESTWVDLGIALVTGFILFAAIRRFWKVKNLFDPKLIFSIFLFVGVASILGQYWILGVNYPEDRTAMFLIVFFFGALFFALDDLKSNKIVALISIGLSLVFFTITMNFTHSMHFVTEHLDEELVRNIPLSVNGTPPTTAGRWNMENDLTRELNLPLRVYQDNDDPHDTLVDYMVFVPERRPGLFDLYEIAHLDPISGQALLKRKKFLKRTKNVEVEHSVISEVEYQIMHISNLEGPMVLRCSGKLEQMTELKEVFIVFSSEDSLSKQQFTYEMIPMIRNSKISDSGEMNFDFSYAMNALEGANSFAAYIWNQNVEALQGKIKLEVYAIEE